MTREDLISDAVALVDRAEYSFDWFPDAAVVVGFRRSGALSLFFGEDEVYHFQPNGEFRRGFWAGKLLKAERGQIVALTRIRTANATNLVRKDLSPEQQQAHHRRLTARLKQLAASLATDQPPRILREVISTEGGATRMLRDWLYRTGDPPVAEKPGLGHDPTSA